MRHTQLILLLLLFAPTGAWAKLSPIPFFTPDQFAGLWNIFGIDDRTVWESTKLPAAAIGRVRVGSQVCTGVLVGPRLVLTTAHCVPLQTGHLNPNETVEFLPNLIQGESPSRRTPLALEMWSGGWTDSLSPPETDWAILLLDEVPQRWDGTAFGWLPLHFSRLKEGDEISLAGYNTDLANGHSLSVHQRCHIREWFPQNYFYHDCDSWAGVSGGPVLIQRGNPFHPHYEVAGIASAQYSGRTDGVHRSQYSRPFANVGVSSLVTAPVIYRLNSEFPR